MKRMGAVSGFRFQVSSFKIVNENSSSFFILVRELLALREQGQGSTRKWMPTVAGNLNSALRDRHLSFTLMSVRRIGKVPPCRRLAGQTMVNKCQKMKGQRARDSR
jgi:hypothetical protein